MKTTPKLSIAPMIDWTNSPFRVLMRLLAPKALLYTEMQTIGAITHNPTRALDFDAVEKPVALQVGGSDLKGLIAAAKLAESYGYDEINLNLGCPSAKVQAGSFGACLMKEKSLVMDLVKGMKDAVSIPVTTKTRIGVDDCDSFDFFHDFSEGLIEAGSQKLVIHARKAWLKGLNPKQNRTIPPVQYDYVYRLKKQNPATAMVINGDIKTIPDIDTHLSTVEGVMLGRLACDNPYAMALIHQHLYPEIPILSRQAALLAYLDYANQAHAKGLNIGILIKPIMNLSFGLPNGKKYKDCLASGLRQKDWSKIMASFVNIE